MRNHPLSLPVLTREHAAGLRHSVSNAVRSLGREEGEGGCSASCFVRFWCRQLPADVLLTHRKAAGGLRQHVWIKPVLENIGERGFAPEPISQGRSSRSWLSGAGGVGAEHPLEPTRFG